MSGPLYRLLPRVAEAIKLAGLDDVAFDPRTGPPTVTLAGKTRDITKVDEVVLRFQLEQEATEAVDTALLHDLLILHTLRAKRAAKAAA